MPFSPEIRQFIGRALTDKIPFAVYRCPGSAICVVTDDSAAAFVVNAWKALSAENIVIRPTATQADPMPMPGRSTTREYYIASVAGLIDRLKERGGKTVVSKVIVGDAENVDWSLAAERLFDEFPQAFCHIYYTPQTGGWLGATPELLLDVAHDGTLSTMALAGTMPVEGEWDHKNRDEHRMVVRFIVDCLRSLGAEPDVADTCELRYGAIKHLCTPISARVPQSVSISDILDMLSPTPAVAGYPREASIAEIAGCELHPRGCYAGYVAVSDDSGTHAFVNLRCARFEPDGQYCIYAGGGITADSDPAVEWKETEAKASSLINIIKTSTKVLG
ncbi:MAG: chorismate-binding protein [Bacteroidales bacterium]|nr:chorismate-binding protein [Bacteroidales bacterium]